MMEKKFNSIVSKFGKILNNSLPGYITEAIAQGFDKQFSMPFTDNVTYVSPDGHRGVVFDKETEKPVTDLEDMGVFIFYP